MFFVLLDLAHCLIIQPHEEKSFISWMRMHNSIYTGDEYFLRLGIYLSNSRIVAQQNKRSSFKVALNHFAALTPAEYNAMNQDHQSYIDHFPGHDNVELKASNEESVDWRTKGVVTEVKNQGDCSAGWAFASVDIFESIWAINTSKLLHLSTQNAIDCTDGSCNGGTVLQALWHIIVGQHGKLNLESDYPYEAVKGRCRYIPDKAVCYFPRSSRAKPEKFLSGYVSQGPVACTIDASSAMFKLYSKGIYDDDACSDKNLNHALSIIGYGSEEGVEYWILKNSWGKSWGEEGYVRFIRGKELCGLTKESWTVYTFTI